MKSTWEKCNRKPEMFSWRLSVLVKWTETNRRETPLRAQQRPAQDLAALEKPPEASATKTGESEAFNITAGNQKRRRRRRQYGEKEKERQVKRKVKKERGMNAVGKNKDEADEERETLNPEKRKDRGHALQEKREMESLEIVMEGGSEHREVGEKKKRKKKLKEQKTTEPTPRLVEAKPLLILVTPPVRASLLKPIEGKLPVLSGVCEDLLPPAAPFKPLPPVTKLPACPQNPVPAPEEVSLLWPPLQVDPPEPPAVPPHPTPAPEEVYPSSPVGPQPPTSSQFEPPPQLTLIDIEDDIESEFADYTGTIRPEIT
ncbi:histone-lysine N-methyltransferase 2B-like [Puntigrus tetrazona]|uniref:histone-lysine N-methyltransferase 2B-like n=1 Tax=Puntigrus tetrazona TaxID=1606681 RepID=UPI001C8A7581|nr:histone-lysine N-methyltransferase 2B-like [Puntigrus tetrazona]